MHARTHTNIHVSMTNDTTIQQQVNDNERTLSNVYFALTPLFATSHSRRNSLRQILHWRYANEHCAFNAQRGIIWVALVFYLCNDNTLYIRANCNFHSTQSLDQRRRGRSVRGEISEESSWFQFKSCYMLCVIYVCCLAVFSC